MVKYSKIKGAVLFIVITSYLTCIGKVAAQKSNLPMTARGIDSSILKIIRKGMLIVDAQKRLEKLGFICKPGKKNSDFGPVGNVTYIYCEHREKNRNNHSIINRWQISVIYNGNKVEGAQAAYNPIYSKKH